MADSTLDVAMLPWFAMSHINQFLHLANELAEQGHTISILIPKETKHKVHHLNLHPQLINFISLTLPHIPGLPPGAETTSDISIYQLHFLSAAFDGTQQQVKTSLQHLQPNVIFFDTAHWLPDFAHTLGIKCVLLSVLSAPSVGTLYVPPRKHASATQKEMMEHPPGFPKASSLEIRPFEATGLMFNFREFDRMISLYDRMTTSYTKSDAIVYRGIREIDGEFCDYMESQYNKPVILLGPILPPSPDNNTQPLEEKWEKWLGGFDKGSVVYCAFGSECVLDKSQFQELVLGMELTGLPFLVRLKPPHGAETVEEALPEGFEERVKGRGVVYGHWVQQGHILNHPSVGCFVTHCGSGSMWESLLSGCQIVCAPHMGDQFMNAKFMTKVMKLAVEVERVPEDGRFTRDGVCKGVKLVMDQGSEVGKHVKANHDKCRVSLLSTNTLESTYISHLLNKLRQITCVTVE